MPRSKSPPRLYLKTAERGRAAVWVIRDGALRRSTGFHRTQRQFAEEALAAYIAEKYAPPTGLGQRLLIDEAVAAYLKGNADSPSFKDFLLPTATPILGWWTGKRISEVNKTNCAAYVIWRTSQFRKQHPNSKKPPKKVTTATARHDLKTLRAALNWFKAAHDPALVVPTVSLPPRPPARRDYCLTRDQVAARLRVCRRNPQWHHVLRLILIGVYSGTRQGVTFKLRWLPSPTSGWIDLESGTIHRSGTAESETNKRKPPVRIHARLLPHLRRWHRQDTERGITHVIHYQGEPIKKLRRAWKTVARLAGATKPDGAHICRHTAATWLMRSGVKVYEAAGYLGMSPETLWNTYGHHHPDWQREAATATGKRKRA